MRHVSAAIANALRLALLLSICWHGTLASASSEQEQLKALGTKITQLKKNISAKQGARSRASKALQKLEKDIGKQAIELKHSQRQLNTQQQKLTKLQQQQQQLLKKQAAQKTLLAAQIRNAYTMGQETRIKMLLNQQDPEKLSRNLAYFDYFNRARSKELDSYRDTLTTLAELLPAIESETEVLSRKQSELKKHQGQLLKQKQQRDKTLNKLDRELKAKRGTLKQLDKSRAALQDLIDNIDQDIRDIVIPKSNQPFHKMRGKMAWPTKGKHLNRFGSPRSGSRVKWQGIQIAGREGQQINAIHSGRVVFADWLRGYGLLIIIDHGGNYMSLYAHNQSLLRDEGDWVGGGEALATVGASGGKRQAGLYFEIRHKGKPTDPRRWCR